jgi:hypothetical protein
MLWIDKANEPSGGKRVPMMHKRTAYAWYLRGVKSILVGTLYESIALEFESGEDGLGSEPDGRVRVILGLGLDL